MTASSNLLASGQWLRTRDATSALGISRDTLLRRCRDGYLKPGQHYIAAGPHRTSPRLWSVGAVRTAMAGWTGAVKQLGCSTSELART